MATSLLFTLPEAVDKSASGRTFTTSHIYLYYKIDINNRHKANNWYWSSANWLNNGNDRIKRGAEPCLGRRTKTSHSPRLQGQGDPNCTCAGRPLWVRKGGGAGPKFGNLPAILESGIHLGQKMCTQMGKRPWGWSGVKDKQLAKRRQRPGRTTPRKWCKSPLCLAPHSGGRLPPHSFGCIFLLYSALDI